MVVKSCKTGPMEELGDGFLAWWNVATETKLYSDTQHTFSILSCLHTDSTFYGSNEGQPPLMAVPNVIRKEYEKQ